ncbi:MAG: MFS transporter [Nitrososphaerota archaeon]
MRSSRFLTLVGLVLIVFVSQDVWVTYSPILTNVAQITGVSEGSIGLLAIIYPIFFLILTIPVGILLDRNFKLWLTVGAVLTFASGALKIFSPDTYVWLMGFQLLGAIGQPFLLNSFTLFASTYYEKRKTMTISGLSFSMYLGTIFSLGAGEFMYSQGGLRTVFLPTAILAVIGIALFIVGILGLERRKPDENVSAFREMKFAVKQKNLWVLGVILGLGVAAYDNLSTWLQPVVQTTGLGQIAGTVVALTLILGLIGILIIPNIITRRDLRTSYLRVVTIAVFLIFAALAFMVSKLSLYILLPLSGFIMLPAYPIIMDWISEFYVKSRQGIATGFMAFVSRIFSVVFTLSALVVISSVSYYFIFLALLILGAVIFAWILPKDKTVVSA